MDPGAARAQRLPDQNEFPIATADDVLLARQGTMQLTQRWAASGVARTRAATIVSELSRNIHQHAGQGMVTVSLVAGRIRILAEDQGPGIPPGEQDLTGRVANPGKGGLGLRGSQRLADTFEIDSAPGLGTRVSAELRLR